MEALAVTHGFYNSVAQSSSRSPGVAPVRLCSCSSDSGAENVTYGRGSARWQSSELDRLLSVQRKHPGNGLLLTRGCWDWVLKDDFHYQFKGNMMFHNLTKRFELFIPEVVGTVQLMACDVLDGISSSVKIFPRHPGGLPLPRPDGYWTAYITRAGESTSIEVIVDIMSTCKRTLSHLQTGVLEVRFVSYGPHGRSEHVQHVVLPLLYPDASKTNLRWRKSERGASSVLAVPTHLLSHLDDPLEVLRKKVSAPKNVQPGVVARSACRLFHPTSSLATACGLQVLVDISGRLRVLVAVLLAVAARLVGLRGIFYRIAGEQARLIDDVTGTLPPYDQFITLGPVRVQDTVNALKRKIGVDVAVVDVNDLKCVQVLAASDGVDHKRLEAALRHNPAGNADEQTPIVLVRE